MAHPYPAPSEIRAIAKDLGAVDQELCEAAADRLEELAALRDIVGRTALALGGAWDEDPVELAKARMEEIALYERETERQLLAGIKTLTEPAKDLTEVEARKVMADAAVLGCHGQHAWQASSSGVGWVCSLCGETRSSHPQRGL